jgi:hypothetical protein
MCLAAAAISLLTGLAAAQSCNTLSGGSTCGAPTRGGPIDYSKSNRVDNVRGGGDNFMNSFSGSRVGLGNELSGNYAPTTFGAITFGGGGARCSGLFRSYSC